MESRPDSAFVVRIVDRDGFAVVDKSNNWFLGLLVDLRVTDFARLQFRGEPLQRRRELSRRRRIVMWTRSERPRLLQAALGRDGT
jgi:hypothetical protein